jgi:hypothetical protein
LGLGSCTVDWSFERELEIRPGVGDLSHEILLRGHFIGVGNPHDLFDWSAKKWIGLYWIYTKIRIGRIDAENLVLTHRWGCVGEREKVRDLKGYVEFRGNSLVVALEIPQYERETGTLSGHHEFYGNGTYTISRVAEEEWKPRDSAEAESFKYDACKTIAHG